MTRSPGSSKDTLEQTGATDKELKAFDQQVANDKAKARARLAKVQKINAGISKWHDSHPEQPTSTPPKASGHRSNAPSPTG